MSSPADADAHIGQLSNEQHTPSSSSIEPTATGSDAVNPTIPLQPMVQVQTESQELPRGSRVDNDVPVSLPIRSSWSCGYHDRDLKMIKES